MPTTPQPRARRWHWSAPRSRTGTWRLQRRGVHHGNLRPAGSRPVDIDQAWRTANAIHFPGILAPIPPASHLAIRRSRAWFERIRRGQDLAPGLGRRVTASRFEPLGSTVDVADPHEIEKVHLDLTSGRRVVARDLFAKLSWVSQDPRDHSLRIRFSFGSERLDDWQGSARMARAADQLATAVFPECALIDGNRTLSRRLRGWLGGGFRLSERIVYANAPGGGATFHHDAEPDQCGVVYAQLAGRTAWLALPRRDLAHILAETVPALRGGNRAQRALDRAERWTDVLDADPRLTRALVEAGHVYVMAAGDVLVLPSHSPRETAWHSVFALGSRPSLAHSYGLFVS